MTVEKPKSRIRKTLGFAKKWGFRIAAPILLFHLGTQLNYWRNDICNYASPSKVRQEFQKKFGIPLKGWKADVEDDPVSVCHIAEAVQREKQERDFNPSAFRMESKNYLKKSIPEQLDYVFTTGYLGQANPVNDKIAFSGKTAQGTAHHEIKHIKTFEIVREHPEFIERWEALSRDENGNSLYRGNTETTLRRIRGIGRLYDRSFDWQENERLGFITEYARSNVLEDIAELCESAENNSENLAKMLFGNEREPKNKNLLAKIALAEEYNLVPKGFREYLEIQAMESPAMARAFNCSDYAPAEEFVRRSGKFLDKYPNSVYECSLRTWRASMLEFKSVAEASKTSPELQMAHAYKTNLFDGTLEDFERAEREEREILKTQSENYFDHLRISLAEYERAANVPFKDRFSYMQALTGLNRCHEILGDNERAQVYKSAVDEYMRRMYANDFQLATRGVSDFIEQALETKSKGDKQ